LVDRIDSECRRAAAAGPGAASAREQVEDLLTEGYLAALTDESRSRRIAERLEALAQSFGNEGSAVEARKLALEKRTLDERVRVLRARLRDLREQFMQLGGHSTPPR
jgi:ribosomal protein L19E